MRPVTVSRALVLLFEETVTVRADRMTTQSLALVGEVVGVKLPGLFGKAPEGSRVHVVGSSHSPEASVYHVLCEYDCRHKPIEKMNSKAIFLHRNEIVGKVFSVKEFDVEKNIDFNLKKTDLILLKLFISRML